MANRKKALFQLVFCSISSVSWSILFKKRWLTRAEIRSIRINGADCGVEAILLGAVTSLGGFLFGYDTGQISSMLIFTDFKRRFGQTGPPDDRQFESIIQSVIVSLMSIGCLIGALSGAYTADAMGRRKSLALGVVVFIIGNTSKIHTHIHPLSLS